jgi:hypothetical protein
MLADFHYVFHNLGQIFCKLHSQRIPFLPHFNKLQRQLYNMEGKLRNILNKKGFFDVELLPLRLNVERCLVKNGGCMIESEECRV